MAHITIKQTTVPGVDLIVDCPNCGEKDTLARSALVTSREYYLGLIPVSKTEQTTVTCEACKETFVSNRPLAELALMNTPQLSEMLANYSIAHVTFLTKFCALLSVLVFFCPIISLILALVALVQTRRRRTRWRTAAWIGFVLGLAVNALFVLGLIYGPNNT